MPVERRCGLQLMMTLLLLNYGLENTSAITQFKPQPTTTEPKTQQMQQNVQSKQQMQQQSTMQQNSQTQHKTQQTITQTAATVQEKDIASEIPVKDSSQEVDLANQFKFLNEMKRENYFQPPPSQPINQVPQLSPDSPLPPLHSFPSLPWNLNSFTNQGFGMPSTYSEQSFSMPNYGTSSFAANAFSAAPYQASPFMNTPRFFPFMGYNHQMFLPYSEFIPSDYFYNPFSATASEFEETNSRAASIRRPPLANGRDSPIFYMRIPPTPYMFLPNFGYPTHPNFGVNFPPVPPVPFQNIPAYPSLGQTYNLPIHFLANGKPTGIHSFIPDIHNSPSFPNFNRFHPRPLPSHLSGNYFEHPYHSSPPPPPFQDSKLTSLKQPFFFNGRPEDIYVLQNPLFSGL